MLQGFQRCYQPGVEDAARGRLSGCYDQETKMLLPAVGGATSERPGCYKVFGGATSPELRILQRVVGDAADRKSVV